MVELECMPRIALALSPRYNVNTHCVGCEDRSKGVKLRSGGLREFSMKSKNPRNSGRYPVPGHTFRSQASIRPLSSGSFSCFRTHSRWCSCFHISKPSTSLAGSILSSPITSSDFNPRSGRHRDINFRHCICVARKRRNLNHGRKSGELG